MIPLEKNVLKLPRISLKDDNECSENQQIMKIGIVTLPLHINFGGYLQNYALQVTLKRLGHESLTLNQRPRKKNIKEKYLQVILANIKTLLLSIVGEQGCRQIDYMHGNSLRPILWKESLFFYDKYITHTEPLNPNKDFKSICSKYQLDALVAGSDQVWRPRYVENLGTNYLSFEKNPEIKKISYAASFGTDQWEYNEQETDLCKKYISDFSMVMVREKSAVEMCSKYFGVESYQVLDPTLLLEKEDYIKLVEAENEPKSEGNMFCYILDNSPRKRNLVKTIASEFALTPFYVNIGDSTNHYRRSYIMSHIEQFKNPSVTKWLKGFMDAEMVIADSFHAVAFSIIFNKPFWVIGNKERGLSRFNSILKMFHLENRLIDETDLTVSFDWVEPIDWTEVNHIRNEWRKRSISLLKKGLEL